jgi:hypothetical protein
MDGILMKSKSKVTTGMTRATIRKRKDTSHKKVRLMVLLGINIITTTNMGILITTIGDGGTELMD